MMPVYDFLQSDLVPGDQINFSPQQTTVPVSTYVRAAARKSSNLQSLPSVGGNTWFPATKYGTTLHKRRGN